MVTILVFVVYLEMRCFSYNFSHRLFTSVHAPLRMTTQFPHLSIFHKILHLSVILVTVDSSNSKQKYRNFSHVLKESNLFPSFCQKICVVNLKLISSNLHVFLLE